MKEKTETSNGFKNFMRNFKKPTWLLALSMVLILVGSFFAQMFNTSFYQVKVSEIKLETNNNNGELVGLLYMPKTCSDDNPCPLIITTHGYLNSKEMQDAPAIELSRRGYIVLALDMYDHGDSTWDTPATFTFWQTALWDAAKVMYEKDYVLKAADGDGMIAVSGHSMGGFSSHLAVYWDEENYQAMVAAGDANAHRKIAVNLAAGADFKRMEMPDSRTPEEMRVIKSHEEVLAMYADRTSGTIAAHFDEFFFLDNTGLIKDEKGNPTGGYNFPANTVVYKDFVETKTGKFYLGNGTNLGADESYAAGVFYNVKLDASGSYVTDGETYVGQRVIYTPYETHPQNHFSTESTSYMIEFYEEAFKYQMGLHSDLNVTAYDLNDASGQIWWLKEGFEFIAMIGLFLAIIPAISLLLKVPFFAKVVTSDGEEVKEETVETESTSEETVAPVKKKSKIGVILSALIVSLIPAYYFPTFITKSANLATFVNLAEDIMYIVMLLVIAVWLIVFGIRMFKGEEEASKASGFAWSTTKGCIAVAVAAFALRFIASESAIILKEGYWWNAPTTNSIGYWALISAAISVLALVITHYTVNKRDGATIKSYGLRGNIKQILIALLMSVIVVAGIYAIVFLVDFIFRTDFRLWVYAVKSFGGHHFVAFLKYVPVFFIYYLVNAILVVANTKDIKGWKGHLYAIVLNIGGLVLFLAYHYGKVFLTGTAAVPTLALQPILLYGLIPSLALAAVFTKKIYEKTNNVWLAAFLNSILFTLITVANTTIYLLSM